MSGEAPVNQFANMDINSGNSVPLADHAQVDQPPSWFSEPNSTVGLSMAQKTADNVKFSIPGVVLGFTDTIMSSLGVVDKDKVGSIAQKIYPQFGDYYQRNKQTLQTVGDITGMLLPATVGMKVVQGGGILAEVSGAVRTRAMLEAGEEVPVVSRLVASVFTSGKTTDEILAASRARSIYLAENRVINPLVDIDFATSVRGARWTGVKDSLKANAAADIAVAATMHSSDTLFPEETTFAENALLSAAFNGTFVGAEAMFMNRAIKRMIAQTAPIAKEAWNPYALSSMDNLIFRAPSGNGAAGRDYGITLIASYNQADRIAMKDAGSQYADADTAANASVLYKKNANAAVQARTKILKDQLASTGLDRFDPALTHRYNVSEADNKTLLGFLDDNPTGLVGMIDIRATPATIGDRDRIFSSFTKHAEKLDEQAFKLVSDASLEKDDILKKGLLSQVDTLRAQRDYIHSLEHFYVEPTGDLVPALGRNPRFWDAPVAPVAKPRSDVNEKRWTFRDPIANPLTGRNMDEFTFNEHGFWEGGKGVDVDKLGTFEHTAMFAQMKKAVDDFEFTIPNGQVKGQTKPHELLIAEKDHWTRLEFIAGLIEKHGAPQIEPLVTLPQAWTNGNFGGTKTEIINSILLNKKFERFQDLSAQQAEQMASNIQGAKKFQLTSDDIRTQLNLPANINGAAHPTFITFEKGKLQDVESIIDGGDAYGAKSMFANQEHMQRDMQEHAFYPEMIPFMKKELPLRGDILNIDPEKKAVFITKKPLTTQSYTRDAMEYNLAQQKGTVLGMLETADQANAGLVGLIGKNTVSSSAYAVAKDVGSLIDGSQAGKQIVGQGVYALKNNPTTAALLQIVSGNSRVGEHWIGELYAQHTPILNRLRANENSADLLKLNEFVQSRRHGWELEADPVIQQDAKGRKVYGFQLKEGSAFNARRYEQLFGAALPDGALMPSMAGANRGAPLFVSELAFNGIDSIRQLGSTARDNQSLIARMVGRQGSQLKEWWVPPRNMQGQDIRYILHPDGRAKTVISGRTAAEADALLEKELVSYSPEERKGLLTQTQETMRNFQDVQDSAFHGMIDYADWTTQNKRATGATGYQTIETGTQPLDDIMGSINNQFQNIIRRTQAVLFEPEINQAKVLGQSADYSAKAKERSIWDTYINTIHNGAVMTPQTNTGSIYKPIESFYDTVLKNVWDKARAAGMPGLGVRENMQMALQRPDREFKKLQDQLSEHNPFGSVDEFVKAKFNKSMPPTMKGQMAALSNLTSTLTLRMFEVGNAVLNGVSLAATMPAVIRALGRIAGETDLEYGARIGYYGSQVAPDLAMFNPVRAGATAMHYMFTEEGRDVIRRAGKAGYFSQEVSEAQRTISAPQAGYVENLAKKGIDLVSKISDKSEEWARMTSFMTGYKIGKDGLKITNERDLMMFANKFADDTIGNYRPQNKPQIFQGAVGMPLGLFQTFAFNYMQRMLGYVENKQWRALATQYGMQASVFGLQSVPGAEQFTHFFASAQDGNINPIDGLRARVPESVADFLLYGSVSSISGMNLYSRGDANVQRLPGLWSLDKTPIFNLAKNAFDGFTNVVDQFRKGGSYSTQHMLETLGTYSINRPMRNLFEMAAGANTDTHGALISNDMYSGLNIASRLMGLRPLEESKRIEAEGQLKSIQASQAYKTERLREGTRSDFRGGNIDSEHIAQKFHDYIDTGGSPEGFSRWLRDQYIAATVSRSDMKLYEALKDPHKLHDAMHLFNRGVKFGNQDVGG